MSQDLPPDDPRDAAGPDAVGPDGLEHLFSDAVALDPNARAAFLSERCAGQPALRQEIASLLAAHDRRGPLDRVIATDTVVGHFRLLDELGRGGMGVVYRAERSDGQFSQRVAVKLIQAGQLRAGAGEALRRYRAERQILAALHHPHIVTLIDAGLTDDGQAYLVMEEVPGVPITRESGRPLVERLRLFQDVCAAVHYAHQHSVVHRDLKPANILVTADEVVKVLDFGVAKLLDDSTSDHDRTAAGAPRPLTPNYASPEQLRGLAVTTACDIYSLGVVLYELVTGVRPYETSGLTFDQIVATVTEQEPPRPSQRVDASKQAHALTGDIDAIVSKAMRKDPAERYASAQALAEDLARHLAGQPILAREPSLGYLVARLARRHKAAVITAALAIVGLTAAFGMSLYETRVALAARTRADARFADVRQLANTLIFKLQDEVQGLPGSTPVRKAIIAEALAYLERLSRDPAGDDGLRLDLASGYHRVGRVQGLPSSSNLGDRDGARQSFKKSIELLRPLATGPRAQHDAAITLGRVDLDLATTARISGAIDEAGAAIREAADLADAWLRRNPADVEARRLRASVFFNEALSAENNGLPQWQRAGELFRSLLAEQPANLDYIRNVALVEKYLGNLYGNRDDWPSAVPHFYQALELDQRRVARLGVNRLAQMDLAVDLSNLARAQWRTGKLDDAAAGYARSLELRQQLADADPQDVYARSRVAFVHHMLARIYTDQHRTVDALEQAGASVRIQEALAPLDSEHDFQLGSYLITLGQAQRQSLPLSNACKTWRRSSSLLTTLKASEGMAARAELSGRIQEQLDDLTGLLAACVKADAVRPARPPRS